MPITVQSLSEWQSSGVPNLLSVVIPAHNEEGHIAETIRSLRRALEDAVVNYEILVINDNSTDQTQAILEALSDERVRFLNNAPPNGFGYAVRLGLTQFRGDCVAIVMADGSDDPNDLVRFYRAFESGADCVFGTRFSRNSKVVDYPVAKRLLNRLGNQLIRLLFLTRYNDTTNAFKLYGRHVIAGLQPLLSYGFNLTVELPLKAMVRGYSFKILSNNWYNRKEGVSKFKVDEVSSAYLFIIFYCWLENRLARHGQIDRGQHQETHLQVWHR
ncbi:MAG: glycosyltransferase family 2 protein [Gammaproteobacteria bacterium]|nr:glycosyltransferase family 2 protein [Gammaproteobacteria bacterium]